MDAVLAAELAAVGVVAGFISALLGVGGGIVMVPALHYVLGVEWHEATALSLAAIMVQSPTGIVQHQRRGAVSWRLAAPLVVGGLVGVLVGALIEFDVPVPYLKLAFAFILVFAAWRLAGKPLHERWHTSNPLLLGAIAVLAGIASKLLGVGGGIVTVPALTLLGTAIHVAVGTSLVPVFTNAAVATVLNLRSHLEWPLAAAMAAGGLVGVPFGAWAAHALDPKGLRRVVAGGLVVVAVYIGATSGVL